MKEIRIPKFGEFVVDEEFCINFDDSTNRRKPVITKQKQFEPDEYIPTTKSAIFIWDKNGNIYAVSKKFGCSYIANKSDYGTLGYTYKRLDSGNYIFSISNHIGGILLGLTWIVDKNGKIISYDNPYPHSLRELLYVAGNKYLECSEINQIDYTKLVSKSYNSCEYGYHEFGCNFKYERIFLPHIYSEAYLNLTIFTFPIYADLIAGALSYSGKMLTARILINTIHGSYFINPNYLQTFKYELPDYRESGWYDLIKLPVLFSITPIYKKEGRLQILFNAPLLDLPLFGTSLVGLATYTSIIGIMAEANNLQVNYDSVDSDHINLFTSPSSNFTDLIVTDYVVNDILNAPAVNMHAYHYEPELGIFLIQLKNIDKQYLQTSSSDIKAGWKVSDFPIDYYQGQFVDSYLFMDYPLYVKLVPSNFKERNYGENGIYYIAENVSLVIGALPIELSSDIPGEPHEITKPTNDVYLKLSEIETKPITNKLQNPTYISPTKPIIFGNSYYYTIETDNDNGKLIPIGVSVGRAPITGLLNTIIDSFNSNRLDDSEPVDTIELKDIEYRITGIVIFVDGETRIVPYSLTQRPVIEMTIRDYICSMFNPSGTTGYYLYCPSSNLPRSTLYSTLSKIETDYQIELYEITYKVSCKIKFSKKIKKIGIGLSGCPIIGYDIGDNLIKPDSYLIEAKPISITKYQDQTITILNSRLSYGQCYQPNDDEIYIHFGDTIYKVNLFYQSKEVHRIDLGRLDVSNVNYPDKSDLPKPDDHIRLLANLRTLIEDKQLFDFITD